MFHKYPHLTFPLLFVLLILCIHYCAVVYSFSLIQFGIIPRNFHGLTGILFAPLIHSSWEHVLSNVSSLIITLYILFTVFKTVSHIVLVTGYIVPGIITWFIGRSAIHIGASGVVYCFLFFMVCRGVYTKKRQLLAVSAVIIVLNSGFIWGILPHNNSISWEYHIGGAVTGCFLAFLFRSFSFTKPEVDSLQNTNVSSTAQGIEFIYTKKPDSH
jgi:membrane associated rhomboid family serine protease